MPRSRVLSSHAMAFDQKKVRAEDLFALRNLRENKENVHASAGEGGGGGGGGMMSSISTPQPIAEQVAALMATQWVEEEQSEDQKEKKDKGGKAKQSKKDVNNDPNLKWAGDMAQNFVADGAGPA